MKKQWINVTKGIGILLVILEHALFKIGLFGKTILMFHMPLFFFISGYCYNGESKSSTEEKQWRKNQILTNVRIYAFFSIVGFIWYLIKDGKNSNITSILFNFANIFYGNQVYGKLVSGGAWFIISLLGCKILYSLFYQKIKNDNVILKSSIIMILSFILGIIFHQLKIEFLPLCINNIFFALSFYILGYILKITNIIEKLSKIIYIMPMPLLIFLTLCSYYNQPVMMHANDYGNYLLFIIGSISGVLAVCYISIVFTKYTFSKIFSFFGKDTLFYFTWQFICLDVVKKLLKTISLSCEIKSIIAFVIVVLLLIPINYFSQKFIKKFFKEGIKAYVKEKER